MTLFDLVVMLFRVWAMYNQSKYILGVLLTIYAIELVLHLVDRVMYSTYNTRMQNFCGLLDKMFTISQS